MVAEEGKTLLEVAHDNDIELEGRFVLCYRCRSFLRFGFKNARTYPTHAAPIGPCERTGACGGELACSTCHVVFEPALFEKLPPKQEEEEDMLDLAWGLTDT